MKGFNHGYGEEGQREPSARPRPVSEGLLRKGALIFGLSGLIAASILSIRGAHRGQGNEQNPAASQPTQVSQVSRINSLIQNPNHHEECYPTGALAGMDLPPNTNNLYWYYSGITGKVPETVCVDFSQRLSSLAEIKIGKLGLWQILENTKAPDEPDTADDFQKLVEVALPRIGHYSPSRSTRMTFEGLVEEIEGEISQVRNNLDFDRVRAIKRMKNDKLPLFKSICHDIKSQDLITFMFTELYDCGGSKLNIAFTRFMLATAGREFIDNIPAIGDDVISFGPYQNTNYVFGKGEGVLLMNELLPQGLQIPERVELLVGKEHHRAAYLYMVNNLGNLLNRLNKKEYMVLERYWHSNPRQIKYALMTYIAACHHAPAYAQRAVHKWMSNLMKYGVKDSRGGFAYALNGYRGTRKYAKQAEKNLDLYSHFSKTKIEYGNQPGLHKHDARESWRTAKEKMKQHNGNAQRGAARKRAGGYAVRSRL